MKHSLEEELLLKKFLLGELPQSEQSEIEERLFADPKFFSQFRAAEDDLIDEYLYGDLEGMERERFEKYFVTTPERRESLRVAKALQQYIVKNGPGAAAELVDEDPKPRSGKKSLLEILGISSNTLRFAMATAAVLIVAVGVWLVLPAKQNKRVFSVQTGDPNAQASPTQVAQGQDNQNTGVQPPEGNRSVDAGKDEGVKTSRAPRQPPVRYSFLILPLRQVRGEGTVTEVKLPANAGIADLKVPLIEEGGYAHYQVALQTESKEQVKSWSKLKPTKEDTGEIISVDIPAKSLREQKYRLVLSGVSNSGEVQTIDTFHFQVKKSKQPQ